MTSRSYLPQCAIALFTWVHLTQAVSGGPLAQAYELRYFTTNPAANGDTDFKGKTEFLSTDQRVGFQKAYAAYGRLFWKDPRLDKEVFPLAEARALTRKIKPQPRPQVRVRLLEDEWAWHGLPSARTAVKETSREVWLNSPDLSIAGGRLNFIRAANAAYPITPALNWRGRLQFQLDLSKTQEESIISLDDGIVMGFDYGKRFFYLSLQSE